MSKSIILIHVKICSYKCSKHCTVVGAQLFADDHWLLLGSWLCVVSGERERRMEREIINYLATLSDLGFSFALSCVVLCCVVDLESCLLSCPGSSVVRELCLDS